MKKIITLFVLFFGLMAQAQNNKDIEYIQIRRTFGFQDAPNQNRLASMLKYHFEKLGYKVYYAEDGVPQEIRNNRCKEYICNVERAPKMTSTELTVTLVDCNYETVASGTGESRIKLRKKAYPEVITYIFEKTAMGRIGKK
jgi:hypothetical protein